MNGNIGVGMVIGLALEKNSKFKVPDTWLPCDGRTIDASEYSDLAEYLGKTRHGKKKQSGLRLPNYSGMTTELVQGPLWDRLEDIGVKVEVGATDSLHLKRSGARDVDTPITTARTITWYVRVK